MHVYVRAWKTLTNFVTVVHAHMYLNSRRYLCLCLKELVSLIASIRIRGIIRSDKVQNYPMKYEMCTKRTFCRINKNLNLDENVLGFRLITCSKLWKTVLIRDL